VLHGLFDRHPGLMVASLENGSDWVPALLRDMDKAVGKNRNDWKGGVPSELFKEHVWVAPYHEEDPYPLIEAIGIEHVLFGSDYPHPEGLAEPVDYVADLAKLSEAEVRLVMRDNALALFSMSARIGSGR
jgi:predicted TIM-barrel fold metal-dependent hydrolase